MIRPFIENWLYGMRRPCSSISWCGKRRSRRRRTFTGSTNIGYRVFIIVSVGGTAKELRLTSRRKCLPLGVGAFFLWLACFCGGKSSGAFGSWCSSAGRAWWGKARDCGNLWPANPFAMIRGADATLSARGSGTGVGLAPVWDGRAAVTSSAEGVTSSFTAREDVGLSCVGFTGARSS